jgi:hypothetical protein
MKTVNPKSGSLCVLRVAAVLAAASLVAIATGGILLSESRSGGEAKLHSPTRSPHLGRQDARTATQTVSQQIARFEILRGPAEQLPADIRDIIQAKPGIDTNLAHRLPIPGRAPFWIVPGNGFLCILIEQEAHSVSSVCGTTSEALTHGVSITLLDPEGHGRTIVGIAPDGPHKAILQGSGITNVTEIDRGMFVHRDSLSVPVNQVLLR